MARPRHGNGQNLLFAAADVHWHAGRVASDMSFRHNTITGGDPNLAGALSR